MNDDMMIEDAAGGGTVLFAGTMVDVLVPATAMDGSFSLLRIANPPGCWTPPHLHRVEDETVYVLSGTIRAETLDGARDLLPGQALVLPRGRPHRLGNAGAEAARFLVLCTPGGFDGFVCAAGRPAGAGETPAMTEADVARLVEIAPRYGIELLAPDALSPMASGDTGGYAAPAVLDVLGLGVEVLAEAGSDADDACLMRGCFPPGAEVPLHSHADREVVHVLDGELQVAMGAAGEAAWTTVGVGGTVQVPSNVLHAIRNPGSVPTTALLVGTRRIAGLFREVGVLPDAVPPGAPSLDRLHAFAAAARAHGFTLAEARE